MRNTAQYKFTAKKIISKLEERLEREANPLYADWVISLMREGFKKQDAVEAFRRSKFILLADGSLTTKDRQRANKRRQREAVLAIDLNESIGTDYILSLRAAEAKMESLQALAEAQRKMIQQMQFEITHVRTRADKLEHERMILEHRKDD